MQKKQTIYSSLFSIFYYKGFSVWRSLNVEESAYMICNAVLKMSKEKKKEPYYSKNINNETVEKSYSTVIKSKKNANITADNFGEIVLIQIPTVNSVTAIAIMKEFKTINNLISKIKENQKCLDGFCYTTSDNKQRKISKTSIKNIIEFLS